MLPRASRLSQDFDFRRVRQRGQQFGSPFFSLFALKTAPPRPSRFGFVVSAKLDKRATRRNRIRRIFQDEVSNLLPQIKPGFLAAFWLRKRALEVEPREVRQGIKKSLQEAEIV